MPPHALLTAAVLVVAFLYSTVGHAGASGYIAVMALAGLAPSVIKPTALMLNILVACLSSFQFWRAGHFSWRVFWPFALLGVPCAFVGGWLHLPIRAFHVLVGIVLALSAVRFAFPSPPEGEPRPPTLAAALAVGAGLGLLSGLSGVGGGIFLTPLLILTRWARTKTASAVSAFFILVNSVAGLAGNFASTRSLPAVAAPLAIAVVIGGLVGSHLGSRRFSVPVIKRLLAVVLMVAATKMLMS
jgi:uncharacterized membrane protein YfcA